MNYLIWTLYGFSISDYFLCIPSCVAVLALLGGLYFLSSAKLFTPEQEDQTIQIVLGEFGIWGLMCYIHATGIVSTDIIGILGKRF